MERIQAASNFILQSPPGEINDVLNGLSMSPQCGRVISQNHTWPTDVRNIISDDDSLQDGVFPALQEYNLAQFTTVEVPGTDHQVYSLHIYPKRPLTTTSRLWARLRDCLHLRVQTIDSLILDQKQALDLIIWALWVDSACLPDDHCPTSQKEASDPQPVEIDVDSEPFRWAKVDFIIGFRPKLTLFQSSIGVLDIELPVGAFPRRSCFRLFSVRFQQILCADCGE